MKYISRIDELA